MATQRTRHVRPTLLVVVEGDAEEALVRYLRRLYTADRQGAVVSVSSAGGKGAANVVNTAIRRRTVGEYTTVAALFDTDTDWNDALRARVRRSRIVALTSEPCLEAWLLQVAGHDMPNLTTAQYKRQFEGKFGHHAHHDGLIERVFTKPMFDGSRSAVKVLAELLRCMHV